MSLGIVVAVVDNFDPQTPPPPDAPAAQESTVVRARAAMNVYNRKSAAFEPLVEEWGASFEVPPPGPRPTSARSSRARPHAAAPG